MHESTNHQLMELTGIIVVTSMLILGLAGLVIYACFSMGPVWRRSSMSSQLDVIENIPTSSGSMYESVKVIRSLEKQPVLKV